MDTPEVPHQRTAPSWLSLLAPLPDDVVPQRKPVASAQQLANGTAGPIAGWQSITVNLSQPDFGLRHVQITLDEQGRLLAGGDHVLFVRETAPHGCEATVTDHESIGGRFEDDGTFRGTHWKTTLENNADDPESTVTRSAEHRGPSADEIAALRRIIDDVLDRLR
jgi:hypothetical protein